MEADCIDYKQTGFFSQTVIDYLEDNPVIKPFYGYRPDINGFTKLLKQKKVIADRDVLTTVLTKQYACIANFQPPLTGLDLVWQNIQLLNEAETYTVTTGHQLNIFAGPLYFIYKIVTAIKLAQQLREAFPEKNFVPVYWMASEDHDFAEISYTNIGGKKVHWWYEASGATGRINPETMRQAINQYKGALGIEKHALELGQIIETAYTRFEKLADATRYLVNALFGRHGLVIIDADDRQFKQQFAPIIERDIIEQNSFRNISATNTALAATGVNIQVNPREINFFYLTDGLRERIVFENGTYKVLNSEISFTEQELKQEIAGFPERFSPNVVMRPLYQECILPNIAYVGGGAELVYWLELKANFDFYGVDFPVLILRNSGLIIKKATTAKIAKMELQAADLFSEVHLLKNNWIKKHSSHNLTLTGEWEALSAVFEEIKLRAIKIDSTLGASAEAVQARLKHAIDHLEKKLVKAERRNYETSLVQVENIKNELFPKGSLQERTENFGLFYVNWGQSFIDELLKNFVPLDFKFTVLKEV
jgi:bacillithiol biosynthesis cysteine-adding enzyme BshC